jgi:hypothetical protein
MVKPWNRDRVLAEIRTGYESSTQATVTRRNGRYTLHVVDDIYLDNPDRRFYDGSSIDEIDANMASDASLPYGLRVLASAALRQARTQVIAERARRR